MIGNKVVTAGTFFSVEFREARPALAFAAMTWEAIFAAASFPRGPAPANPRAFGMGEDCRPKTCWAQEPHVGPTNR